jgi:heme/copper-type cytochrome/quinol oxidase subunit 1
MYRTFTDNITCPNNPWADEGEVNASTLEWLVSSPPPFHTFDELPVIKETHAATAK